MSIVLELSTTVGFAIAVTGVVVTPNDERDSIQGLFLVGNGGTC